jgi:hypothetical protein
MLYRDLFAKLGLDAWGQASLYEWESLLRYQQKYGPNAFITEAKKGNQYKLVHNWRPNLAGSINKLPQKG